jgi:hypothetical protein
MDKDTLKIGLTKYINHIIKPKVDYEIVINTRNTIMNKVSYIFYIVFIIDHSKFWRGNRNNPNPNFSQEYNDEVNKLYMDEYLPELETSVKLFGISEPDVRQEYRHTNKSIYDPLIKSLNNDYNDGDFRPEFMSSTPALGLDFIDVIDTRVVQEQLYDEGFDTDDIAFY